MKSNSTVAAVIILLLLILFSAAFYILKQASMNHPKVELSCRRISDHIEFLVTLHNVPYLLEFTVTDKSTKELLWSANLNYFQGPRVIYGDPPSQFRTFNGVINSATQLFPEPGIPPKKLQPGKEVIVGVTFGYGGWTGESTEIRCFVMRVSSDGRMICAESDQHGDPLH